MREEISDVQDDLHLAHLAEGYHRCPDGKYRRIPSNGMFDGLCGVCELYMYDEYQEDNQVTNHLPE